MGLIDRLFGTAPEPETRSTMSISDPAFAAWLTDNGLSLGDVTTESALSISAYWRGVNLIAGTIAGLPLKTYRNKPDDTRERVKSFLDKPAGPYKLTSFAWKEMAVGHMVTQGECFLLHIRNGAGAIIGAFPIHPGAVSKVEWRGFRKVFTVNKADGSTEELNDTELTQVMGFTLDGIRGVSPLTVMRRAVKIGLGTDLAALSIAVNGMSIAGLVTPSGELDGEDAKEISKQLNAKVAGHENAGRVAVINRALTFTPWQMTAADAEFLASREFNVTDFARFLGIPPHLLMQTEKQTSWGTGVAEQNVGLSRYTLMGWTSRLEEALSELLPANRFAEFDYKGLLKGSPADEIKLLIEQVEAGLLTPNEARRILDLPALPDGDTTRAPSAPGVPSDPDPADEAR